MPVKAVAPEQQVQAIEVLGEDGQVDTNLVPALDHDTLLRLYRAMVLTRKLDERMIAMQRQGEMGTFAPGRGQEATQIGQVFPLEGRDWYAPSYRSFGAQIWRGWSIEQLLLLWDGYFEGFAIPDGVNDLPFSIVIGLHVPVAVGVGMSLQRKSPGAVVLANFGDGASSEGDVSEALNFAAVYKVPVVFVCENNGFAISTPTERQTGAKSLAHRGPGFGIPAYRVDGNDLLAMIVAARRAVERARDGGGPTLIEAVTYRIEMHTTSDDPKVYRDDKEVELWRRKDPITRFGRFLTDKGVLDQQAEEQIAGEAEQQVLEARERFRKRAVPKPQEIFDFVYANPPAEHQAQRSEYLAKLEKLLGGKPPKSV